MTAMPTVGSGTSAVMTGVACPSTTFCVAVGYAYLSGGGSQGLVFTWNGSAWTDLGTPGVAASWSAVSCAGVGSCMVIGGQSLVWNGASWTLQAAPPGSATAVSCTSSASCMAVGWQSVGTGGDAPTAASWDGAAWSAMSIPSPTADSFLLGVSCSGTASCTAVGYQGLPSGDAANLVESWDGGAWAVVPSPTPSGTADSALNGVACVSSTNCVAAGRYFVSGGGYVTLVEAWDGSAWTIASSPSPSTENILQAVACVSTAWCTAVGFYGPVGTNMPLAEVGRQAAAATTTSLSASANPVAAGQSVTFTATVSPTPDGGTVSFSDGGLAVNGCTRLPFSGGGTVACTTSFTSPGTHTIQAGYSGDLSFGSSLTALSESVQRATTATTLVSGGNPSIVGQAVTFTATVSVQAPGSGTPTGTVAFSADAVTIAGCGAQSLAGGQATCTTSALGVGTHGVVANYNGGTSTGGSTGSTTQAVGYAFALLYNATSPSRAGSTLSLKVELQNSAGADLSASSVTVTGLCVVVQPATDCAASVRSVNQVFGFVSASRKNPASYSLSLSTKGLARGSYNLVVSVAGDPIGHLAPFVLS
jgi:hypothetical protein